MRFVLATVAVLLGLPTPAHAFSLQEQSIYANLLAQEFVDVCVRSDADIGNIRKIAELRAWKSRPKIFTGEPRDRPDYAWDGSLTYIPIGSVGSRAGFNFAVGVRNSAQFDECYFVVTLMHFGTIVDAMRNQGLSFDGENEWGYDGYEFKFAAFCARNLYADDHRYTILAEYRVAPDRTYTNGIKLSYKRIKMGTLYSCGGGESGVYSEWTMPPEIEIKPWLGQKPIASSPAPLNE